MENKGKNKNKKRLLILVALVGVMGIGGVVAATSISINAGVPISLGAGYTTATTCDTDVTITASQTYQTTGDLANYYTVSALNVSAVNTNGATTASCGNKTMQLAYVTTGATVQASWALPSSAITTYVYQFGPTGDGTVVGTTYRYASVALVPFDIATLSTVALSIS
jgi:hypothetical protein